MHEEPTVDDVDGLAPFRVVAPCASAALRGYTHVEGKITAVTVAGGGLEVTTQVRDQIAFSLPFERQPEDRAAAAATAREATIDVDGAPVPFTLVEHEGRWAAVADIGEESITIAARDVPPAGVALQTVSAD